MTAVRYVCVSDLHLGAMYSVLNRIDQNGNDLPDTPNTTLIALARGLRGLLQPPLIGDKPPTLVLLGDILEFAFASRGEVIEGFRRFIEQLFPEDEKERIFDEKIIVVPGNHDHHLWNTEVDNHFLNRLKK